MFLVVLSVAKIALTNMVTMTAQTACGKIKGHINSVVGIKLKNSKTVNMSPF